MSFTRTIEDFVCGRCDCSVTGTGYTNHCPKCLWSKHVDVNPGDRASDCGGMMEPIGVSLERDGYVIRHRCVVCGFQKPNKTAKEDDFEMILKLSIGKI
jgi:hypothetical protein